MILQIHRGFRTNVYWVQLEIPDTSQSQIRPGRPWGIGYIYLIFYKQTLARLSHKNGGGGGGERHHNQKTIRFLI